MLTHSQVVYLIIYVRDLNVSRVFYERRLGMQVLEEDEESVKYDCGQVMLCLNRAASYGIQLPTGNDESTQVVFLVQSIQKLQDALEARGVQFPGVLTYEAGSVADFYDPDGHHLVLYEPSEQALEWSSGDKVRAIWATTGEPSFDFAPPATAGKHVPTLVRSRSDLAGVPVVYVFQFVDDTDEALRFYHQGLGLEAVEGGPCSRTSGGDEEGVVKYDAGGLLLSTHHMGEGPAVDDDGHVCPPRFFDPGLAKGVATVFHVPDLERTVGELQGGGVALTRPVSDSVIGKVAGFEDPSGHPYFLYQASPWALAQPSGRKLQEILSSPC
jgi:predicted enzyme related to lactoylglutathione lyase